MSFAGSTLPDSTTFNSMGNVTESTKRVVCAMLRSHSFSSFSKQVFRDSNVGKSTANADDSLTDIKRRRCADSFDYNIYTLAVGELHDGLDRLVVGAIDDCGRAEPPGDGKSVVVEVDHVDRSWQIELRPSSGPQDRQATRQRFGQSQFRKLWKRFLRPRALKGRALGSPLLRLRDRVI